MKFKLNDWKKVSQGEKHTVLRNKHGHELRIFHSKLSPQIQKQLINLPGALAEHAKGEQKVMMAEGGETGADTVMESFRKATGGGPKKKAEPMVEEPKPQAAPSGIPGGSGSPSMDASKVGGNVTGSGDPLYEKFKQWMKHAQGGQVKMANGGDPAMDEGDQIAQDAMNAPVRPEYEQALAAEQAKSSPQSDAIYGTPEQRALQDVKNQDAGAADKAQYEAQTNASRSMAHLPPLGASPTQDLKGAKPPGEPAQPKPITDVSGAAPTAAQSPLGEYGAAQNQYLTNINKGVEEGVTGKYAEAAAIGHQGQAEANALQKSQDTTQHIMDTWQKTSDKVLGEMNAVVSDISKGHIDPNHYLGSMNTGQRIATGIGLFLGGLGAPANGGHNTALDFFNKQIERDVDAQKAELGKKENLVSAYMRQYGNLRDATQMAMATQGKLLENQLLQAASTAKDPIAAARAKQGASDIHLQYANMPLNVAKNQALIQLGSSSAGNPQRGAQLLDTLSVIDPQAAAEWRKRSVPDGKGGMEFAKEEVTPADRDTFKELNLMDANAKDLMHYIKNKSTWSVEDRQIAEEKALALQAGYRAGNLQTVYKAGEQPLLDKAVSESPLSFKSRILGTEPAKLQELINANARTLNAHRQKLGLPSIAPAPEVKVMNGKQYRKVQGGWQLVQ